MAKVFESGRIGTVAVLFGLTAALGAQTGRAQTTNPQTPRPPVVVAPQVRTYPAPQTSMYPGFPGQTPGRVTVAGQARTNLPGLYPGAVPLQTGGLYPGTNSPYPPGYNPPSPATVTPAPSGGYYPYGGGTTVIINNGYAPYNGYANGPYGNGSTTITTGGTSYTIFSGYQPVFVQGQTVASPFALYGCPAYIGTRWAVNAPYAYAEGAEMPSADAGGITSSRVSLKAALGDLTRYWEGEDVRALRRRLSPDLNIAVFQAERYSYALKRTDFLSLSADALDRVETVGFRFDDVRDRNDGLVNAYATHTYKLRGGSTRQLTARVRCTLVFVDNDWFLSAVSFSPGSLGQSPAR